MLSRRSTRKTRTYQSYQGSKVESHSSDIHSMESKSQIVNMPSSILKRNSCNWALPRSTWQPPFPGRVVITMGAHLRVRGLATSILSLVLATLSLLFAHIFLDKGHSSWVSNVFLTSNRELKQLVCRYPEGW